MAPFCVTAGEAASGILISDRGLVYSRLAHGVNFTRSLPRSCDARRVTGDLQLATTLRTHHSHCPSQLLTLDISPFPSHVLCQHILWLLISVYAQRFNSPVFISSTDITSRQGIRAWAAIRQFEFSVTSLHSRIMAPPSFCFFVPPLRNHLSLKMHCPMLD
ncbi:hypothetical protein IQ07DRAFT_363442 [Pyrenochaeta sp. DS3sAY3a]|nr:hypothetical protein IQ07DRAFT_363442 [Pyrenochaeta sp. DS3sAY3a]